MVAPYNDTKRKYIGFSGATINPMSLGQTDLYSFCLVLVNTEDGRIIAFEAFDSSTAMEEARLEADEALSLSPSDWTTLSTEQFLIPGFIDLHTHAPQYRNLGLGLDFALLEWLEKVTFLEERWYGRHDGESEVEYCDRLASVYSVMAKHYLRCGTTTCCYYGSLQLEANQVLAEEVAKSGQRALIGKVCMDSNSPSDYVEETEKNINDTIDFINFVRGVDAKYPKPLQGRILPIVTPRFALTCTESLMTSLAQVATEHDCHIQTHMSENKNEIAFAQELFPASMNYAHIYEHMGLLTPKTILAHCIHMTEQKKAIIKKHGCAVAHCPNSNFALNSGVLDIRGMLEAGIKVGLGSDVSGGYGLSMLDAIRQAIVASKTKYFENDHTTPLRVKEAFYLATLAGAEALEMSDQIGNFQVGKRFDALVIDMAACPVPRHSLETLEHSLSRFIFTGDDRWISQVYVNGQKITTK